MDSQKERYLSAKVATELFQLNPEYLSSQQRAEVASRVATLYTLQQAILASPEAQQVQLIDEALTSALASCQAKFDSEQAFMLSLQQQQLTLAGYRQQLWEELVCDQVMATVASDVPPLSRKQAFEYYLCHREQFSRAAMWQLQQILITINDDFADNRRNVAKQRIMAVRQQLSAHNFGELALRYSECPSAIEQGQLGWCEQSKLYPELATALTTLAPLAVSPVIETELGFHLLLYRAHKPATTLSFHQAWPLLEQRHRERASKYLQKQWLNSLLAKAG